jgi:hypothetical protein
MQVPNPLHTSSVQTLASEEHSCPNEAMQLSASSLHTSKHSPSPVHGSPLWMAHPPPTQESLPLQNKPSSHGTFEVEKTHPSEALHDSIERGLGREQPTVSRTCIASGAGLPMAECSRH